MSSFFSKYKNLVIALPAIVIIAVGSVWAANHNEFLAEQALNNSADQRPDYKADYEQVLNNSADQNPDYEISCPDRSSLDVLKCITGGKGLKITAKKQ